ncbi:MAG TPA: hypothetical protein PKH24_13945 [Sedimentisphaerales bacterium]|nr:hypothetical protein [Sedimentisphaerales bacterium]HNU28381.1 hypothetical protein [Sedimentisphaerales bacterium]
MRFGRLFGRGRTRKQPSHLLMEEHADLAGKAVPPSSSRQYAKRQATKTLQTAMLARRKGAGGISVMQRSAGGSPQHSRVRPAKYASPEDGAGRQKVMIVLIPILAVALLYLLKNPLSGSTVAKAQDTKQIPEVAPTKAPDIEIAWELPPLYQPGGRDPMRLPVPAVVVTVEEPVVAPAQIDLDLVVTGILHSEDRPAAIIGTAVAHEGEQISGATVKKIEKNGVEFEMNGRTWKQAVGAGEKR